MGYKIVKIDFKLKYASQDDIYKEMIQNKDPILNYLDIRDSYDLVNKVNKFLI